ncbi:hypothetical protein V1264_017441 [Littorina saxatilis]|uniref:Uncharacterized protein n=1 Tax=Littorina saxatilis TaxID=31220 RepID=A0AAN9BIL6_9CAEN
MVRRVASIVCYQTKCYSACFNGGGNTNSGALLRECVLPAICGGCCSHRQGGCFEDKHGLVKECDWKSCGSKHQYVHGFARDIDVWFGDSQDTKV